MHNTVLTTSALTFSWPDGTPLFSRMDLAVPPGRSALVGDNGSGKSTLIRLLAGELRPASGSIQADGRIGYLPQDLPMEARRRVDDFLGVGSARAALARLESGTLSERGYQEAYEIIGERWDAEDRARADLERVGLDGGWLDRRLGELSGGEVVQLALARLLLEEPEILLLDEPTNNLDRAARLRVHDIVRTWAGSLLVVSHDRELLELVDRTAELHDGEVRWFGGGWSSYTAAREAEDEVAAQAVRTAEGRLRREQRDLAASERTLAQRRRTAAKAQANKKVPGIVMGMRKNSAEVAAGSFRAVHEQRLERARDQLDEAQARLRDQDDLRIDLPETEVADRRVVLRTDGLVLRHGMPVDLPVDGPERIAVVGGNGTGKSTLLHTVAGDLAPLSGRVDLRVPARLLPQRLDVLHPERTIVDNVVALAPEAAINPIRAQLARFGFRGASAAQLVGTLSGGELLRATLAGLLLATPAPLLLMLDEPTNSLDVRSVERLVDALAGYRGALLVASHDETFLDEIGITRRVRLGGVSPAGR